jgi:hypothetical protein
MTGKSLRWMLLALLTAGCSNWEPIRIVNDTPEQLQHEPPDLICEYAGFSAVWTNDAARAASEKGTG